MSDYYEGEGGGIHPGAHLALKRRALRVQLLAQPACPISTG